MLATGERHGSLAVVPLIGDKRYYGEAPMWLRRFERAVRGGCSSHSIDTSGRSVPIWHTTCATLT
jgi:hypothetical protein